MQICIITDNPTSHASKSFLKEASFSSIKTIFVPWKDMLFDFEKNDVLVNRRIHLKEFSAVILRSSETSLTPASLIVDYCDNNSIRLLNKDFYLRYQSVNKLRQQLIFQIKKIPCLKTVYSETISFPFLKKKLGLPFIAKLASGSLGKQVFKINSDKEFLQFMLRIKKDRQPYLFQKFYKVAADYRVFIVGNKVFGPLKRIAPKGEWRTNIRGAKHERAEEKKQVLKLAKTFQEKTGIEFAGLDILIDSVKKPRIIEINTMACFKVFDEIYPKINIAKKTIDLLRQSC